MLQRGLPKNDTFSYGATISPYRFRRTRLSPDCLKLRLQGAQAVIGHIDRAWAYSFQSSSGQAMVESFGTLWPAGAVVVSPMPWVFLISVGLFIRGTAHSDAESRRDAGFGSRSGTRESMGSPR